MNKPLKYQGYSIVFQEVPDEVSLAINISGCPYKCRGCHSKYLWDYKGNDLVKDFDDLLSKYDGLITCACFMGGDQNSQDLIKCLEKAKQYTLKTCLYTGADAIGDVDSQIVECLDYIKVGKYIEDLGGLDSPTTNQRMYDLSNGTEIFFNGRKDSNSEQDKDCFK